MKIQALSFAARTREWQAAAQDVKSQRVKLVTVPLPDANEASEIAKVLGQEVSDDQLQQLARLPINFHIYFEDNSDTKLAFNTVMGAATSGMFASSSALAATQPNTPTLTVTQGAAGGALLGGVGGAGTAFILMGLKSTGDAFGNPYLSALGAILVGTALGGLTGTIVAKTDDYWVNVRKGGLDFGAGRTPRDRE